MALHDFTCRKCSPHFVSLVRAQDSEPTACPKCKSTEVEKKIARFAVGGQGDLRESTLHGCHEANVSLGDKGHKHSSGCGH